MNADIKGGLLRATFLFLVYRLFLFGTVTPAFLGQLYRKRWTIGACFQNLKGRGFALRSTPLQGRSSKSWWAW